MRKPIFIKKQQASLLALRLAAGRNCQKRKKRQMEKHLGKVISVEVHEPAPGEPASGRYADITIAYPDVNFSRDIPALLVTVFGKLSMDGKIKLIDLHFSSDFLAGFSWSEIWDARCTRSAWRS